MRALSIAACCAAASRAAAPASRSRHAWMIVFCQSTWPAVWTACAIADFMRPAIAITSGTPTRRALAIGAGATFSAKAMAIWCASKYAAAPEMHPTARPP
jgi:hypothetical protein